MLSAISICSKLKLLAAVLTSARAPSSHPRCTKRKSVRDAGVPFRETHHISGAAVKLAEDRDVTLFDLTVEDLKGIHPQFEEDVLQVRICAPQNIFWGYGQHHKAACLPYLEEQVNVAVAYVFPYGVPPSHIASKSNVALTEWTITRSGSVALGVQTHRCSLILNNKVSRCEAMLSSPREEVKQSSSVDQLAVSGIGVGL